MRKWKSQLQQWGRHHWSEEEEEEAEQEGQGIRCGTKAAKDMKKKEEELLSKLALLLQTVKEEREEEEEEEEQGQEDAGGKGLIGKLEKIRGKAKKENMTKSQIVAEIKDLVSTMQGNWPPTRSHGNEREANKSTREGSRSRSPRGQWWRKDEEKEDPWHNGVDPWARAATPGTGKGKGRTG